jgi:hypothetical protein
MLYKTVAVVFGYGFDFGGYGAGGADLCSGIEYDGMRMSLSSTFQASPRDRPSLAMIGCYHPKSSLVVIAVCRAVSRARAEFLSRSL